MQTSTQGIKSEKGFSLVDIFFSLSFYLLESSRHSWMVARSQLPAASDYSAKAHVVWTIACRLIQWAAATAVITKSELWVANRSGCSDTIYAFPINSQLTKTLSTIGTTTSEWSIRNNLNVFHVYIKLPSFFIFQDEKKNNVSTWINVVNKDIKHILRT